MREPKKFKMKKILVPIDFTDNSDVAFNFAIEVSKKHDCEIILLHIIYFPAMTNLSFEVAGSKGKDLMLKSLKKEAKERLMEVVEKRRLTNLKIRYEVKDGDILEEIISFAKGKRIDLMVLGIEQSLELRNHLFGALSDRIIHSIDCPVLVLKQPTKLSSIKKLLVANDLAGKPTILSGQVQKLKEVFNAKIHIVKVNTPQDFTSEVVLDQRLAEYRKQKPLTDVTFGIFSHYNVAEGVLHFAGKSGANMIVIGGKRKSFLRRLVIGEDLAEEVIDHSNLPVWVF